MSEYKVTASVEAYHTIRAIPHKGKYHIEDLEHNFCLDLHGESGHELEKFDIDHLYIEDDELYVKARFKTDFSDVYEENDKPCGFDTIEDQHYHEIQYAWKDDLIYCEIILCELHY